MASKRKPWSVSREKNTQDAEEDLLVFGYSCKLFRDDEKAHYIEQGKHLIPWMGDDQLMIDRYDGRGYLHDLGHFEAKSNQDPHAGLTDEEIKVESLCDEERYHSLYKDIAEEEMYHEEEMKRLRRALASDGAYNEVCFTYNEESNTKDSTDSTEQPEEASDSSEEQPFIAPSELALPEGMEVPPTVKMNAIVEKTAVFVAQQGLQMEIVIKTKQSKNSQFSFMQFDHPLNPYYKHMINCIKSGKYKPASQGKGKKDGDDDDDDDDDDSDEDSHYLHPSLLANKSAPPATQIPKIQYVSGLGDDYYSLLVKQLKGKVAKSSGITDNNSSTNTPSSGTQSPNVPNNGPNSNAQTSTNSLAPVDPSLPPPPGLEPVTLPPPPPPPPPSEDVVQGGEQGVVVTSGGGGGGEGQGVVVEKKESRIVPPSPDIQPIIDKMACYVAKNGKDFEMVVLNKGDKRFDFLHEWHELNPYYLFKKTLFEQQLVKEKRQHALELAEEIAKRKLKEKAARAAAAAAAITAAVTVPPPPVSFSIKSKDSEMSAVDRKNALQLGDESSESETGDGEKRDQIGEEPRKIVVKESRFDKVGPIVFESGGDKSSARIKNEILEARLAEERLKDRLAAAARDKLSSASREKLLQLDRKKRAALFLTMLKKDKNQIQTPAPEEITQPIMIGPQLLPEMIAAANEEQTSSAANLSYGSRKSPLERKRTNRRDSRSRSRSPAYYKRSRRSRSRSHQRSRYRSRSKSPVKSSYSKSKKARTPPAAYSVVRRSRSPSPRRHRSRSTSRDRNYKRSSRGRYDHSSSSTSRHRSRHSRSNSKSRTHRRRGSSHSKSRSRSKSPHSKKSSRSPSLKKIDEKTESPDVKENKSESRSSSPEISDRNNNST